MANRTCFDMQIWHSPSLLKIYSSAFLYQLRHTIRGLYLEVSLKYQVKQSKNGNFRSNYKASPIDF